jgi:NTE family protein
MTQKPLRRIGLALGSGAARGWAHVGVIHALEERGIHADCVAGTSIGALVGAAYAARKMDELEGEILRLDWKRVLYFFSDPSFHRSGLVDGKKIADFLRNHAAGLDMESLPTPLHVVATDLHTGKEVCLTSGDIINALRASIAIPGVFTPVEMNGMVLVDGGLVNPLPVGVARKMEADFVIAVDVGRAAMSPITPPALQADETGSNSEKEVSGSAAGVQLLKSLADLIDTLDIAPLAALRRRTQKMPLPHIFEVLMASITIMEMEITETRLKTEPADLLIRPSLGHIGFFEFNKAEEAVAEGYRAATDELNALPDGGRFLVRD